MKINSDWNRLTWMWKASFFLNACIYFNSFGISRLAFIQWSRNMTLVLMLFAFRILQMIKVIILTKPFLENAENYKFINIIALFLYSNSSSNWNWGNWNSKIANRQKKTFYLSAKLIDAVMQLPTFERRDLCLQ